MGQPAARQGDIVAATDIHVVMIPSPAGPAPMPAPHPFNGRLNGGLSQNVNIMGSPAATVGSTADNLPPHVPQGGPFQKPPLNRAQVVSGSPTVRINGKPAARNGDQAMTCNDPVDQPIGSLIAVGTVLVN